MPAPASFRIRLLHFTVNVGRKEATLAALSLLLAVVTAGEARARAVEDKILVTAGRYEERLQGIERRRHEQAQSVAAIRGS